MLVDGRKPGELIAARSRLPYRIALRSPVPVDHLELVRNGQVLKRFDLTGDRMRGEGGRYAKAIPHDALVRLLKQYRRYTPGKQ